MANLFKDVKFYALDTLVYLDKNGTSNEEIKSVTVLLNNAIKKEQIFENLNKENHREYGFFKSSKEDFYIIPVFLLPSIPEDAEIYDLTRERKISKNSIRINNCFNTRYAMKI